MALTLTQKIKMLNNSSRANQEFQLGTMLAGGAVGSFIDVSPDGSDTLGNGTPLSPVASLTKAMTLVTSARKVIRMAPGEYAEAATVVWSIIPGVIVKGAGAGLTVISALLSPYAITVTPGVVSSTWTGYLYDATIDHSGHTTGTTHLMKGIKFDNTAMTKKLLFGIKNCEFSANLGTDKSIDMVHGDADNAIRVYITGDGSQTEIQGQIYFDVDNVADRLEIVDCWLTGGNGSTEGAVATSDDAHELRIRMLRCMVPLASALSGGSSTQVVTARLCYSWVDYDDTVPEIYHALETTDLIGNHTEVIADV